MTEQRRPCDLVNTQMSLLCQEEGEERAGKVTQFTLETAITTRRVIIVKMPYSDMNNLPPQVIQTIQIFHNLNSHWIEQIPLKVRMYSTISVPLETKQLIRRIQRAEQLTVSINLQVYWRSIYDITNRFSPLKKNLHDTEKGRELLESIDLICTGEQYYPPPVSVNLLS